MSNLVTTALQSFAPDIVSRLASSLGVSPALTRQGLNAIIPALFGGALKQSATASGAEGLAAAIGGIDPDRVADIATGPVPVDAASGIGGEAVSALLGGGASQGILGSLASLVGLPSEATSSLAGIAAPLVLGTIGKAITGTPTPGAVQSLLAGQRSNILSALPSGAGALLGLGTPQSSGVSTSAPAPTSVLKWWPWLLGALALLGLIYGLTQCSPKDAAEQIPAPLPAGSSATESGTAALKLPDGTSISVLPGSIGYQLATFLASSDPAPKTFVFDNLTFSTGSDTLTSESGATVSTIASILKAYPNAAAAVVGYTDNRGDPAANRILSEGRAKVVTQALVTAGIDAGRLLAKGLGEGSPIADNGAEEGRAKNRRTELTITKK